MSDLQDSDSAIRIVSLQQDFEAQLRAGGQPDISAFVEKAEPKIRERLRDSLTHSEARFVNESDPRHLSFAQDGITAAEQSLSTDRGVTPNGDSIRNFKQASFDGELFGDYDLIKEIGRGGMGVVYQAQHTMLDRMVAIKILPGGKFASPEALERFSSEALAAGGLEHPNIVPVYNFGCHNESHFLEMKLIDGQPLSKRISEHGPFHPKSAAILVRTIVNATAFAHQNEVIHRDLKPANILLENNLKPWIVDFGLAKKVNSDSGLTRTGLLLGTPAYVAPELATGEVRDPHATLDVYGIGGIMYTVLTGNPPHSAHSVIDIIKQVRETDPVRPREVNPSIPIELETICLKCLSKSPDERYQTAQEVSDELERYLQGKPIIARPESIGRRGIKYAQRNRVTFFVATITSLVALLTASGWWQARTHLRESEITQASSLVENEKPGRRFQALDAISTAASIRKSAQLRDLAVSALSNIDVKVHKLLEADRHSPFAIDGAFERYATCQIDGQIEVRSVKDDRAIATFPKTDRKVLRIEFSEDGMFLAACYHKPDDQPESQELFRIWNVQTQSTLKSVPEKINGNTWSFDNNNSIVVVSAIDGTIQFLNLQKDVEVRSLPPSPWLRCLAITTDGKHLAIARDEPFRVEIISVETGKEIDSIESDEAVQAIAWQRGSGLRLACSSNRRVTLWDLKTGRSDWSAEHHDVTVDQLAFSNNGDILASSDWSGKVCLWRVGDGERVLETAGQLGIRFSNNDKQLAGAVDAHHVGIWNVSLSPEAKVITPTIDPGPQHIDFSKCGRVLATASRGSGLSIWQSNDPVTPLIKITDQPIGSVRFTNDGILAAGISQIHFWRFEILEVESGDCKVKLSEPNIFPILDAVGDEEKRIDCDESGQVIAMINSFKSTASITNLNTNKTINFIDDGAIGSVSISSNGKFLATGTASKRTHTRLYNAKTGKLIKRFKSGEAHVSFTPDSKQLIIGSETCYRFIELEEFKTTLRISRSATLRGPLACRRKGSVVAVNDTHDSITLYNWKTGKRLAQLRSPTNGVISDISFSQSGRYLSVATESQRVHVWNLEALRCGLEELGLEWSN